MIILSKPRFSYDRCLFVAQTLIFTTAGFAMILFLIGTFQKEETSFAPLGVKGGVALLIEDFLGGPFLLSHNSKPPLALALERKLILLAQSARPDLEKGGSSFRIGLEGSDQKKVVREGEPFFAHLLVEPYGGIKAISFADRGEVKIVPQRLDDCTLILEVETAGEKTCEVVLQASGQIGGGVELSDEVQALKEARMWGNDAFFLSYGESSYRILGQKYKIELKGGDPFPTILFVGPGDYLTLREKGWETVSSVNEAVKGAPLAEVFLGEKGSIEIEAWDGEGFPLFKVPLLPHKVRQGPRKGFPQRKMGSQFLFSKLIEEAKLRTANQVTCKIGKKRWILKPGDWLLKTQVGWKKLKNPQEIDAFLSHKISGELLVIDMIDPHGLLKGHHFDEMRIQKTPFSIQAQSSKRLHKKGGK